VEASVRALRTRGHLLPLLRESASVRGVSESSKLGEKVLASTLAPLFGRICIFARLRVESSRHMQTAHFISSAFVHLRLRFPYGEGGFLYFNFLLSNFVCVGYCVTFIERSPAILWRIRYLRRDSVVVFPLFYFT
jgi:hypothetical protein